LTFEASAEKEGTGMYYFDKFVLAHPWVSIGLTIIALWNLDCVIALLVNEHPPKSGKS
jgi:hypothetical protein